MIRSRAVSWLGALLIGVAVAVLSLRAQAGAAQTGQNQPPPDPATALLVGAVVDGVTGRPIAGAIVTAVGTPNPTATPVFGAIPGTNSVLTGSDGRFLFSRLKAGRYTIDTERNGYLRGGLNSVRPGMSGSAIDLQVGEQRTDLTVRIWKSATLGGLVLDDTGEPAINVDVRFVRRTTSAGRRVMWNPSGSSARTDDRGMYRVADLIPGDYVVYIPVTQTTMPSSVLEEYHKGSAASTETYRTIMNEMIRVNPSNFGGGVMNGAGSAGAYQVGDQVAASQDGLLAPTDSAGAPTFAFATVFHPNASSIATATPIRVASGDEKLDLNFQLRPVRTIRVSGTLVGPEGPLPFTRVSLSPPASASMAVELDTASTLTDVNGQFTLLNVPQGQYVLRAMRVPRPPTQPAQGVTTVVQTATGTSSSVSFNGPAVVPPLPPDPVLWTEASVTAGTEDITGMMLAARHGPRVQGRVEFVGSAVKPDEKQMAATSVRLTPADGRSAIGQGLTRVSPTGELTSQGFAAGSYLVTASNPGMIGWTLASIMHGGVDVSQSALELSSADVTDLVITFTDQKTTLSGTLHSASGAIDPAGMVVVFPADAIAAAEAPVNVRRLRNARVSALGKFTLTNLPPGEYYVVGLPADEERWSDPPLLQSLRGQAVRVKVAYGQIATVDVTIRKVQ